MFTLPAYFQAAARRAALLYVVEIIPRASDTWTSIFFATRAVTVDGDLAEGGLLASVSTISQKVDIQAGGAAAGTANLSVELLDGIPTLQNPTALRLHELLVERNIEGREVAVSVALDSPNQIPNASVEEYSAHDADDWLEFPGSGTITIETASPFHGAAYFDIDNDAPSTDPYVASGNTIRPWRRGEDIIVSLYAKADAGTPDIDFTVKLGGVWWNEATQLLTASKPMNRRTITTSWAVLT